MSGEAAYLYKLITSRGLTIPASDAETFVSAKNWLKLMNNEERGQKEKASASKIEEVRLLGDPDVGPPPPAPGSESPESVLRRASVGAQSGP